MKYCIQFFDWNKHTVQELDAHAMVLPMDSWNLEPCVPRSGDVVRLHKQWWTVAGVVWTDKMLHRTTVASERVVWVFVRPA